MCEKRFAVTQTAFGSGIYDFQAEDTLCESYDEDAYGEVCKKLNNLHEEKEILFDVVKKADDLINRFGSDRLKHEWKKEVTVKYR